eukprot:tig00000459_g1135.t1
MDGGINRGSWAHSRHSSTEMKRGADPKRHPARLAIDLSDDESPPKRRSTSHLPGVPLHLVARKEPQPEPETLAEIKQALKDVRELGGLVLDSAEPHAIRLAGVSRPVAAVRIGPEATAEARRIYRQHFRGPAVRMLDADDIADVLAFRMPDWARQPTSGAYRSAKETVHLALRLRDGTCQYWNCWDACNGHDDALYRACWKFVMRRAVRDETNEFYDSCKRESGGRRLTCSTCGAIEGDTPHHVDHAQPDSFARTLLDFCRLRGLERPDGRIEAKISARRASEGEEGNYHLLLPVVLETVPPTLSSDFADYHRSQPKQLRVLCRACNVKASSTASRKVGRYTIGGRLVCERNGPFDRDRPASSVRVTLNARRSP